MNLSTVVVDKFIEDHNLQVGAATRQQLIEAVSDVFNSHRSMADLHRAVKYRHGFEIKGMTDTAAVAFGTMLSLATHIYKEVPTWS